MRELIDRKIAPHPWSGWRSALVFWFSIGMLLTAIFFSLGLYAMVVASALSLGVAYWRKVRVDHRAFERSLLCEQCYRSPQVHVYVFDFASWFYAEAHPSEYLFIVEARDGRWFSVVSEDAYYFIREGVPRRWAVRVYAKTQQVIDVTGTEPLGLIQPHRVVIAEGEEVKEFAEYQNFAKVPPALSAAVLAAKQKGENLLA